MADNYLENKMDQLRSGRTVIRRANPSLDSLIRQLGEDGAAEEGYIVKQAQLDAAVRSAAMVPECAALRFETDEAKACIRVLGHSSPRRALTEAGEAILAIRLKAAELGLRTKVEVTGDSLVGMNPLLATIALFK